MAPAKANDDAVVRCRGHAPSMQATVRYLEALKVTQGRLTSFATSRLSSRLSHADALMVKKGGALVPQKWRRSDPRPIQGEFPREVGSSRRASKHILGPAIGKLPPPYPHPMACQN